MKKPTAGTIVVIGGWLYLVIAAVVLWLLCPDAHGEWFEYAPPRSTHGGGIYEETISRCPAYGWKQISSWDKATQCHEATHFIDHDICQPRGQMYGAFYVGEGRCFVVSEPKLTVGEAAQLVPHDRRLKQFKQYLTGDRASRNCLSILDEWAAYTNDAQCTVELELDDDGGYQRAVEFCAYVDAVVEGIKQSDPQYPELTDLEYFIAWQKDRLARLARSSRPTAPRTRPRLNFHQPFVRQNPRHLYDSHIVDPAPEFRWRNRDGSCANCSITHCLRWLGLYDQGDYWYRNFHGGESDYSIRKKLDRLKLNYAMTNDGDERLLEWGLMTRRGIAVTWGGAHCVNLMGRVNGQAVILDNNQIGSFKYQPWNRFLREWRNCGGWAFVILDGEVPPPIPG